jgi:hypothetical protein
MDAALLKWETLQQAYEGSDELDRVFDKLLAGKLSEQRLLLARYDRDLGDFERHFKLDSPTFYARFEAGELGDDMDYFEWAGLWELRQRLRQKIQRLEQVLP